MAGPHCQRKDSRHDEADSERSLRAGTDYSAAPVNPDESGGGGNAPKGTQGKYDSLREQPLQRSAEDVLRQS